MASITTRAGKGSPLTNAEVDANFTSLNTELGQKLVSSDLAPYLTSTTAASTYQPLDADLTAIAGLAGTSGFLKKTADNTWALDTSTYLTGNQTITFSGDATGSGATSVALTLANSGVTAGTYTKVTTDAKGRVTAGASLTASDIPALTLENLPDAWTKRSVRVATTANITLSGTQTIDGVAVAAGDRVLVKDQTAQAGNGIYVVAAGAWSRATDANAASELAGANVSVDSGTANGGLTFDTDFKSTDTLGTTAMTWARVVDTALASSTSPAMDGTATIGTSISYARADHIHPTDTSRAPSAGSTSITTLGTIGTGAWQGSVINSTYGGTGVNNGGRTLTINTNSGTIGFTNVSTTLTVVDTASVSGTNTGDQTITLTGDVTGSGTGSFATTLANSGVTAGTYTKVTTDAKGRVTAGTSLASADVTTALGYTPYNSTNPNGYITSSGSISGNAATATTATNLSGGTINGMTLNQYNTQNARLYVPGAGAVGLLGVDNAGTFRYQLYGDGSNYGFLNGAWAGWDLRKANNGELYVVVSSVERTVLTSGNYNSYAPTLTGGGASGTWGISITGSAGSASTATTATNVTGGYAQGSYLGVQQTGGSGQGISLYNGYTTGQPTYGIMFATTANFGTHGSVTADWATYFTMDSTANRGWVFRNTTSGNVASINNAGTAVFNGNVTAYSDEALKSDWATPPADFIERVAGAKRGTYTRVDTGERHAGSSAQDWQKILPEVVVEGGDGRLSLAYGNAALVVAIELARRVVFLESQIQKLIGD